MGIACKSPFFVFNATSSINSLCKPILKKKKTLPTWSAFKLALECVDDQNYINVSKLSSLILKSSPIFYKIW